MSATGAVPISRISLQYLTVPVQATKAGTPYNPTDDVVQFAFVDGYSGSVPSSGMWVAGSWVTLPNYNYPYAAQCLVGPGGSTAPTTGIYTVWMQIQDNPEVPVLIAGMLQVI
jgi:hypothetical protein